MQQRLSKHCNKLELTCWHILSCWLIFALKVVLSKNAYTLYLQGIAQNEGEKTGVSGEKPSTTGPTGVARRDTNLQPVKVLVSTTLRAPP